MRSSQVGAIVCVLVAIGSIAGAHQEDRPVRHLVLESPMVILPISHVLHR
jgi:hypothetical protein